MTNLQRNKKKETSLKAAANRAQAGASTAKDYYFPIQPPNLPANVAPQGITPPVMAMDFNPYGLLQNMQLGPGFPGYPYLAQLSTRAEYRAFAAAISTELTREWIKFTSKQDDDDSSNQKLKDIEAEFERLDVRAIIGKAAEHDCYFGRAQILLDILNADASTVLILHPHTVTKGSLKRISTVEPIWTTPSTYNTNDPSAPDFYKPHAWFMIGKTVHASRLLTIITRPVSDMLKPAFNFGGMSLSQLAEPYVDNWLRTRQSVSDLINNFSITVLATDMGQVLQDPNDDGSDLIARAKLFTAMRINKGLMVLDKEREELVQINTPLSGLHELQAQSQEHMCSVSRIPAMILTGISPSGLNASSEGEIRAFYDWIAAMQEAHYRKPLQTILQIVQLSLFGEIDPDIGFDFNPLYQLTDAEKADARNKDANTAAIYIDRGVIDPSEQREVLARNPDSGYQGLDLSIEIIPPVPPGGDPFGNSDPENKDTSRSGENLDNTVTEDEWKENDHPRAENGQFSQSEAARLFDSGDVQGSRKLVKSSAESFADRAEKLGLMVNNIEHSGSSFGPSSYVTISGVDKPFRFSNHSKGAKEFANINHVDNVDDIEKYIKQLEEFAKAKKDYANSEAGKSDKALRDAKEAEVKQKQDAGYEKQREKFKKAFEAIARKKESGESLNSNEKYALENEAEVRSKYDL